jgi:hypothetical protein
LWLECGACRKFAAEDLLKLFGGLEDGVGSAAMNFPEV